MTDFGQTDFGQKNLTDRNGGSPKLWGPRSQKNGARRVGAPKGGSLPKFCAFFPLPPPFRSFCVSLGVFSWNFWWCLKRRDPQMCTFGEPKRAHFRVPAFKHTTKIQREDPEEREERTKIVAGEGRRGEILGGPAEGGPGKSKPTTTTTTKTTTTPNPE